MRNVHLIQVPKDRLKVLLEGFDPAKTKQVIERFSGVLEQKAGKRAEASDEAKDMLEGAIALLTDLQAAYRRAVKDGGELCLRRLTEAEASSEPALGLIRQALSAPRIILT